MNIIFYCYIFFLILKTLTISDTLVYFFIVLFLGYVINKCNEKGIFSNFFKIIGLPLLVVLNTPLKIAFFRFGKKDFNFMGCVVFFKENNLSKFLNFYKRNF